MLHKKYLEQFKAAAVRQLENGKDINQLARELNVSTRVLYDWYRKRQEKSTSVSVNKTVSVQKISADGKLTRLRAPNPSSKTTIH